MNLKRLWKAFQGFSREERLAAIDMTIEKNRQKRLKLKETSVKLQKEREELLNAK